MFLKLWFNNLKLNKKDQSKPKRKIGTIFFSQGPKAIKTTLCYPCHSIADIGLINFHWADFKMELIVLISKVAIKPN